MTLSDDFKDRLYRHLRGQDTVEQKIEFREILSRDKELERIYYELKEAHFDYTPEKYSAFLQKSMAESLVPESAVPVTIAKSRPGWFAKLVRNAKQMLENGFLPDLQTASGFQFGRLAFLVVVLVGAGWGISIWRQNKYHLRMAENFGNVYGPSQGNAVPDACGNVLKNKYYLLQFEKSAALQNIKELNNESIESSCKAYYLGRSYLSLAEYENAIKWFAQARTSGDTKIQEMATFDLALSYILDGDKEKGLKELNGRVDWSYQRVVDNLKKEIE